jgi:predicted MFS family arabinose efflux permease
MVGNIISVALWVSASTFPIFLASRVVGGLSEGNVQLAIAIATDVSTKETRGHTLALVGVAFSIAFTLGPMMGAWLSSKMLSLENPFMTAALFSLGLLVVETLFLWAKLPETRKTRTEAEKAAAKKVDPKGLGLLKFTHLFFLLIFSGMEFSLPFMTYDLFNYSSAQNGRVLGFIGLLSSLLQGGFSRRAKASVVAKIGLISSAASFFLLARTNSQGMLYLAAVFLAVTSACVVTALNTLASLRVGEENRGRGMGEFRSAGMYPASRTALSLICKTGQIGRAIGPVLFCKHTPLNADIEKRDTADINRRFSVLVGWKRHRVYHWWSWYVVGDSAGMERTGGTCG